MKTHIVSVVGCCLVLFSNAGCDTTIHEYPELKKSLVILELHADRMPPTFYKEVVFDFDGNRSETLLEPDVAAVYLPDERLCLHFVTELYSVPSAESDICEGHLLERRVLSADRLKEAPQDTLHFHVPTGLYRVLGWVDYAPVDSCKDWHFDTGVLTAVEADVEHKPRNNHHKSSAAGRSHFAVDLYTDEKGYPVYLPEDTSAQETSTPNRLIPVYMKRPSARFRLLATDLQEFQEGGNDTTGLNVRIVYKQYVSAGYNVDTQTPNQFVQTRTMDTSPSGQAGDGTVLLAYDYVLTSDNEEDHVLIDIFITDREGNEINAFQNISVPLRRNQETIVKGPFLTKEIDVSEIGIDDTFEDEHIIVIPD